MCAFRCPIQQLTNHHKRQCVKDVAKRQVPNILGSVQLQWACIYDFHNQQLQDAHRFLPRLCT